MKTLVIGSGYVGGRVAKVLPGDVVSTTTTPEKVGDGIILWRAGDPLDLTDFDSVIVCVAPARGGDYAETYSRTVEAVIAARPQRVVYISSTSVYGSAEGVCTESTPIDTSGVLGRCEELLLQAPFDVCILRLSGIYGPGREIQKRIGKVAGNPDWPTNHIHVDDIVAAVLWVEQMNLKGVYNLCNDSHPTRGELYGAKEGESRHGGNRIISNDKIKATGFTFLHPTI